MQIDFAYRTGDSLPLAEIRAAGPVVWSDSLQGWVVSSYDAVKTVLSDVARFTSEGTPIAAAFGAEAMLTNDTPMHHVMRAVWAKHVSKDAIGARAAVLERIAGELLLPVRTSLEAGETVDLTSIFQRYVIEVIGWLFAVPRASLADLQRWNRMFSDTPVLELTSDSPLYTRHLAAKQEVFDFLTNEMRDRRERMSKGEPLDDMIALMAIAEGRDGITHAIARDNLMNFFLGALDTTTRWLGNIVVMFGHRPALREQCRSDAAVLPPAIEEIMRIETVVQVLQRLVKEDTELAGHGLARHQSVFVFPGAANRDPVVFEQPNAFDLQRAQKPHLGFGFGFHHCLGINIARQEVLAFARVLLERLPPLAVVACDYGTSWALRGPKALRVQRAVTPD